MSTPAPTPEAPVTTETATDLFNSCTRFDEIAIARAFGDSIYVLRKLPFDFLRAMAFVHMRRAGKTDAEASAAAFNLTTLQARAYFAAEPAEGDDLDDDDYGDDDDQGKGAQPSR